MFCVHAHVRNYTIKSSFKRIYTFICCTNKAVCLIECIHARDNEIFVHTLSIIMGKSVVSKSMRLTVDKCLTMICT